VATIRPPAPYFLDVWQTEGLHEASFGSVAIIGLTGEFLGCAGKERASSAVMCLTQKCNSVIGKKWQDDDLRFGRAVVFAVYTRIVRFTVNLNPLTTIDAATICSCGAHRISAGDSYPPTLLTCDYSHFIGYFR